ncbi:MAG: hypothetical protein JKX84_11510 [Flavobacteriales bacterium]|nr:hypothetical protein [Flavobacteriales bacterium]
MKQHKIFGIGLSRTGTSSLNRALEILGSRSVHFPIIMRNGSVKTTFKYRLNKWGRELGVKKPIFWDFASESGNELKFRLPNGDEFDAMTDLPVARFYRELDKEFPNSKFILTTRNEEEWLESCRNFFAEGNHQFFKWMQLHFDMYGTNTFDKEMFQSAYRKHIADVKQYFCSRPNDLLILDIPNGDGWEKLCSFLEQEIPNIEFPNTNAAKIS